jgi:hypothetical protein
MHDTNVSFSRDNRSQDVSSEWKLNRPEVHVGANVQKGRYAIQMGIEGPFVISMQM